MLLPLFVILYIWREKTNAGEKTEIERCDFIHVHEDVVKKVKEHIPAERELNDLAEFLKCSEM